METSQPTPQPPLKYWSDSRSAYEDGCVRIEWTDAAGVTRTTMGRYWLSDNCVTWEYSEPASARIYNLAAECGADAGEYGVVGAEFMGWETRQQMEHAVESCCQGCGKYVGAPDELSEQGRCVPCFVEQMGTTGVVAAAPRETAVQS